MSKNFITYDDFISAREKWCKLGAEEHGYNEFVKFELRKTDDGTVLASTASAEYSYRNGYSWCFNPLAAFFSARALNTKENTGLFEVEVDSDDGMLGQRFKLQEEFAICPEFANIDDVKAWRDWWLSELPKLGLDVRLDGTKAAVEFEYPHKPATLAKLTLIDYFQRSVGIVWMYRELRRRLPSANPWHLFQIAHMPLASQSNRAYVCPHEFKDKLLAASCFFTHGNDYLFTYGGPSGTFKLTNTFKECVQNAQKHGSINKGFFDHPDVTRVPRYDWSFDDLAEFATKHIEQCFGERTIEAYAVCC